MNLRKFKKSDSAELNQLAVNSFEQYSKFYQPWEEFKGKIAKMSDMAIEITIAEVEGKICGAIGFVAPTRDDSSLYFQGDWAAIRMLVVDPASRGQGLGRKLTEACINQAKGCGAKAIALHTSPIMEVALPLYLRMGFVKLKDIDPIYAVSYAIYKLDL